MLTVTRGRVTRRKLPLFGDKSPLIDEISQLDVDSISPLEAITRLYELKQKAKDEGVQ